MELRAKRKEEVCELSLDGNKVIEIREFKDQLRAKAFYLHKQIQYKNNGWNFEKEVPIIFTEAE